MLMDPQLRIILAGPSYFTLKWPKTFIQMELMSNTLAPLSETWNLSQIAMGTMPINAMSGTVPAVLLGSGP